MKGESSVIITSAEWNKQKWIDEARAIFAPEATDEEFAIFCQIGRATGLNPFLREIWMVKGYASKSTGQRYPAQIFIGRDGYRKSAQSNPEYSHHFVDAVYENDEFHVENGIPNHKYRLKDRGCVVGAYCSVFKFSCDKPFFVFVDFKEYTTNQALWKSAAAGGKPATMIKKVAEAQALRMAFQSSFSGTYSDAEFKNADYSSMNHDAKMRIEQIRSELKTGD